MANIKEVQKRIKSINDTMKITKAMYMISSIKLRKAKQELEETEPFFYGMQEQIARILEQLPDVKNLYFDNREEDLKKENRKKGYVVITADKGMAGAYNHNVLKFAKSLLDSDDNYKLYIVGEMGKHYFERENMIVSEHFSYTAQNPTMYRAQMIAGKALRRFERDELDEVYIVYTRMINSIQEEVDVKQLLPLNKSKFVVHNLLSKESKSYNGTAEENNREMCFWPSVEDVIKKLVHNYTAGIVYGALVESFTCEQNSRMIAMQSATDNAKAMLNDLSIEYNRIRQAEITQEITEVISGAKAMKKKKKRTR